jgi:hypothetical protein
MIRWSTKEKITITRNISRCRNFDQQADAHENKNDIDGAVRRFAWH